MVLEEVLVMSSASIGLHGSTPLKHCRGGEEGGWEEEWKTNKMARSAVPAPILLPGYGHGGGSVLSFGGHGAGDGLAYRHRSSSDGSAASSCYGNGDGDVQVAAARSRGPFTASQWLELEHQAMIYKHLVANIPVPSSLITLIRRSLASSYSSPSAYYGPASLGWSSYHLGYAGINDLEPNRCRRTDGKKWRCSRDAVGDQKYCERHLNRGRNRSRKPVEGHSSHTAKPPSAAVKTDGNAPGRDASSNLNGAQDVLNASAESFPFESITVESTMPGINLNSNEHAVAYPKDSQSLSMLNSTKQCTAGTLFSITEQADPFDDNDSRPGFSIISNGTAISSPNNNSNSNISNLGFFDAAPRGLSDHTATGTLQYFMEGCVQHCTELRISMPNASPDFSSSPASPITGKLNPVADFTDEPIREANWARFQDVSVNGPLGEVLNKNNTRTVQGMNCSFASLKLLADGSWDVSPQPGSPTDVLQKAAFGSVSSSTRSSPRFYDSTIGSNIHDELSSILH